MVFDKFRQLGELKKIRDQALTLQRQLAAEEIVIEERGVRVVISGDQRIKELTVQGVGNEVLTEVLNKAIKCSQEVAAQKLREMSGGLMGMLGK